jgi:hypothetical protein
MTVRRRVFFTLHYQIDIGRVHAIRDAWTSRGIEEAGIWDKPVWEGARRRGNEALKMLILEALEGTTSTVVLIGPHTWERPWIHYQIDESRRRGNGLLGIRIHKVRGTGHSILMGGMPEPGENPFEFHLLSGRRTDRGVKRLKPPADANDPPLSTLVPVYDWVDDKGSDNVIQWIEAAEGRGARTRLPPA